MRHMFNRRRKTRFVRMLLPDKVINNFDARKKDLVFYHSLILLNKLICWIFFCKKIFLKNSNLIKQYRIENKHTGVSI